MDGRRFVVAATVKAAILAFVGFGEIGERHEFLNFRSLPSGGANVAAFGAAVALLDFLPGAIEIGLLVGRQRFARFAFFHEPFGALEVEGFIGFGGRRNANAEGEAGK